MKRITVIIFLVLILGMVGWSQETIPFSLKNFLEEYTDSLNRFFLQEEFSRNFKAENYFLNFEDTLFWPDNYKIADRFYRKRLGLVQAYNQFARFKNMSSISYHYSQNQIGDLKLVKSKSTHYYDKYRINLTEEHVFNSTDFFGGTDSIVKVSNYYDIISWFDPSSKDYSYVYRINKIHDNQTGSRWSPKNIQACIDYYVPYFQNKIPDLTRSSGYGVNVRAAWLLGGKKFLNYSFLSGLGYSAYDFRLEKAAYQFSDNTLIDRDNYPFTLKADLKNLYQSFSFSTLNFPLQLELTKYDRNGKLSGGLYGGFNLHFPLNPKLSNSDGEVTYSGKYKFSFYNDSILLENLDYYNFRTFTKDNIKSSVPELKHFFVSAQIGGELSWYLGKRWVTSVNFSYLKSLTPFYSGTNQKLAYNIINKESGNRSFEPALNSFLALHENNRINSVQFGIGLNYIFEKPVIPYGKVGYNGNEIKKLVRSKLVLNSGSFSQNSREKIIYVTVKDTTSSKGSTGQKMSYRFIGPSPKFYKQGKINTSSLNGTKLTFMVPVSNSGAKMFIEEPYGYGIYMDKNLEVESGGTYGEIKVIRSEKLWKREDDRRNLEIGCSRLKPVQLFLINYKYNLDDRGEHKDSILSRISRESRRLLKQGCEILIYIVSDEPEAFEIRQTNGIDDVLDKLDIKLRNTNDVFSDLEGLKSYILKQKINLRRKIDFILFTSFEFIDEGRKSIEEFPKTMNIDSGYVSYVTFLHSYGQVKSPEFEKSFNYLKKIGTIKE